MTMPHLENCPHQEEGWCLSCVMTLHERAEKAERDAESEHNDAERLAAKLIDVGAELEALRARKTLAQDKE